MKEMKTWSKEQEAGPSQFRPHFDLSRASHEGSDSFLYHPKVVNKRENKSGLTPSGDVKNVTSNVLPEAPVDETTFREKHHNQRKSKFTIFKSVKKLQDHWFAPFVRSGRIRWALLLALSLCRICKSVLHHNKAVNAVNATFVFVWSVFHTSCWVWSWQVWKGWAWQGWNSCWTSTPGSPRVSSRRSRTPVMLQSYWIDWSWSMLIQLDNFMKLYFA